jgi:hypothetical protein
MKKMGSWRWRFSQTFSITGGGAVAVVVVMGTCGNFSLNWLKFYAKQISE